MKLTEQQIWQCNNTEDGGVHICLDHQNVVDFARAIEREIGFTKAELWIKRINDAVLAEREAFAKIQFESILQAIQIEREACAFDAEWCIQNHLEHLIAERIRARGQA